MTSRSIKYTLEIIIPEQLTRKIEVIDHLFAGLDPRSDIILIDPKVKNRQFLFQKKDNVLSVQLLGADKTSYLNMHPMEKARHYVIDVGDTIEVGKVTIKIYAENSDRAQNDRPLRVLQFDSLQELQAEDQSTQLPVDLTLSAPKKIENPPKSIQRPKEKRPILLPLKIQAFILDFHLTYVFLTTVLPLTKGTPLVLDLMTMLPRNSFIKYLFFVWVLRVVSSFIFSKTPGEALIGLTSHESNFFKRFASLLLLSLHDAKKDFFFYPFMRKIGFIFFILLCLISPFFLPLPFSAYMESQKDKNNLTQTLQTQTVQGHSKELGMTLKAEVPMRFYLLPLFEKNLKRAFILSDVESRAAITVREVEAIDYRDLYHTLRLGNPFYQNIESKIRPKDLLVALLSFAPLQVGPLYQLLGPYWGSGFMVKREILKHMSGSGDDGFTLNVYSQSIPLLKIENQKSELILLLARDKVIIFKVIKPVPYHLGLDQALHRSVLTQFYLDETEDFGVNNSQFDLLSAQDDWSRGNLTGPLTFMGNEAKKLSKSNTVSRELGILFLQNKKEIFHQMLTRMDTGHRDEMLAKSKEEIKNLLLDVAPTNDRKSSGTKNVNQSTKNPRRR